MLLPAVTGAVQTVLDPTLIPKFVDPMPFPPALMGTSTTPATPIVVTMSEFQQQILPAGMYPPGYEAGTYVWGYNGGYPGPTIVAIRGTPTHVKYVNHLYHADGSPLVLQEFLYPDQTTHWANPLNGPTSDPYAGPVAACVHLHGGEVPSAFDGGPDMWFTPNVPGRITGKGFVTDQYTYPNSQEACTMFYHDHLLGMTSQNVYAGMAAFYLLVDPAHTIAGLPGGAGDHAADQYGHPYDFGVALQDKMFDTNGQEYFDHVGINPEHPSWVPEMFGNAIVVNGRTWPYLEVEPRRYRIRFVNGSTARFYRFKLEEQDTHAPGPVFWQIASDQGFLDHPVKVSDAGDPNSITLLMAPGERTEIVVDFAGFAGERLVMVNDAPAPFPDGDLVDAQTSVLMQFRVGHEVTGGSDPSVAMSSGLGLRPSNPIEHIPAVPRVRALTLNEDIGAGGPLDMHLNNTMWDATPTEGLRAGDTEVWEIINLTADTHPMHTHLMAIQILDRQGFDKPGYLLAYTPSGMGAGPPLSSGYNSLGDPLSGYKLGGNPDVTPYLVGAPIPPDDNERGWKDTFRMNPDQVTRILVRVGPQDALAKAAAASPPITMGPDVNLYPFEPWTTMGQTDAFGYPGGEGYVWHCHITDHEDNEMMRPMFVYPPGVTATTVVRFDAVPTATGVRVTWELKGDGVAQDAALERAAAEVGPWMRVRAATTVLGAIRVVDDPEVVASKAWYRLAVRNADGSTSTFGPILADGIAGVSFALGRVAPNPSTDGRITVSFGVANQTTVRMEVLDVQGRQVAVLADGTFRPGNYSLAWDGAGAAGKVRSGVYFVRYAAAGHEFTRRVAITQ
jgi:FtsP/CotA-like multicopper oxidase with cupredoxin domain